MHSHYFFFFFFFNDTATTEIYTLSLHDALPISSSATHSMCGVCGNMSTGRTRRSAYPASRSEEHTSESSHRTISYADFCLKKKMKRDLGVLMHDKNQALVCPEFDDSLQ